jgi:hypothetical protein
VEFFEEVLNPRKSTVLVKGMLEAIPLGFTEENISKIDFLLVMPDLHLHVYEYYFLKVVIIC